MKSMLQIIVSVFFILLIANSELFAQVDDKDSKTVKERILPFGAAWAREKGIELPLPFGVSVYSIFMSRDIDVTSVSIEFMDREPQNIDDFATFGVRNRTSVNAIKFDAWVLPVLNVYFLGGLASTDANVSASFTVEHDITQRPPTEFDIETSTRVKGPYAGIGSSLVAGYGSWFVLGDVNYGKSWPEELETPVDFLFASIRSGFSGKLDAKKSLKAWIGGAYIHSKSTLGIKTYSDVLSEIMIYIQQEPVNPWTAHCGLALDFGKHFGVMTEIGSNFNDASISVVTASWRF